VLVESLDEVTDEEKEEKKEREEMKYDVSDILNEHKTDQTLKLPSRVSKPVKEVQPQHHWLLLLFLLSCCCVINSKLVTGTDIQGKLFKSCSCHGDIVKFVYCKLRVSGS
jgi:hypothetical protein